MYNRLSNRMLALTDLLDTGLSVADIGCDHAFVSIYLVKEKLADKVIAMDIGKGPLEIAKQNIAAAGLVDKIETRLSDGAKELSVGEVQAAIIAGMGGMLMEKILKASSEVFRAMKELVLQPQSDLPHFRKFLDDNGYEIIDENMIYEDGKYYPMMKVIPAEEVVTRASVASKLTEISGDEKAGMIGEVVHEAEEIPKTEAASGTIREVEEESEVMLTYGPVLISKKSPVLKEFLLHERENKLKVLCKLEFNSDSQRTRERIVTLRHELKLNELALGMYLQS